MSGHVRVNRRISRQISTPDKGFVTPPSAEVLGHDLSSRRHTTTLTPLHSFQGDH
jgi:hypothetical protein